MLFPAVMPHLVQRFGQVQVKFMGIRVLAGIVTSPTVVTQIGQMRDVAIADVIVGKTEQYPSQY